MGKDNVPFHTVGLPGDDHGLEASPGSQLTASRVSTGLNYDGGQFSTSGKRGIFMDKSASISLPPITRAII